MNETSPDPDDVAVMRSTALFLFDLADKLDGWAEASRSGGWSTHQVEANRATANDCRRQAAAVMRILPTT